MPISLPIRQVCGESYLPNIKIYLSRTTGQDFFRALRLRWQRWCKTDSLSSASSAEVVNAKSISSLGYRKILLDVDRLIIMAGNLRYCYGSYGDHCSQ